MYYKSRVAEGGLKAVCRRAILIALFSVFTVYSAGAQNEMARLSAREISATDMKAADTVVFRFVLDKPMFYSPYKGNEITIPRLAELIEMNRADIEAGNTVVRVNGYCNSHPTRAENIAMAKERSNHVKSYYILKHGMKEEYYKTANHATTWKGQHDVVAVCYLETIKPSPLAVIHLPEEVAEPAVVAEPVVEEPIAEEIPEPIVPEPVVSEPVVPEPVMVETAMPEPEPVKKPFMPIIGIKTNLIYLAGMMPDFNYYTPTPNIEAEWYFAKRWSLSGSWAFADWCTSGDEYLGLSAWDLEPRIWFKGDDRFRGFYAGLYGSYGQFNVRNDRIDDFGRTGDYYGGGLSLGYHIAFSNRWGAEIGVKAGYRRSDSDAYSKAASYYYYDYTEKEDFWGITGIKAMITYRFGKSRK